MTRGKQSSFRSMAAGVGGAAILLLLAAVLPAAAQQSCTPSSVNGCSSAPPGQVCIASFTATNTGQSSSCVLPDTAAQLNWTTTNATGCMIVNYSMPSYSIPSGNLAGGSYNITPARQLSYQLSCQGPSNSSATAYATINMSDTVQITGFSVSTSQLTACPSRPTPRAVIDAGSSAYLYWSTLYGSSCTMSPSGTVSNPQLNQCTSGIKVTPSRTTDYTLNCEDGNGYHEQKSTRVVVAELPRILSFQSDAANNIVTAGTAVTVSWTTANARSCQIATSGPIDVTANGSMTQTLYRTTDFTLSCTGRTGTVANPPGIMTIRVTPP